MAPPASSDRPPRRAWIGTKVSPHTCGRRSSPPPSTPGPIAGRGGGLLPRRPRITMRYNRARTSLDRHDTYIVTAFTAGAAR
jgi:hypothetical protein